MILGYKTHAYGDLPIEKIFYHIHSAGYQLIELCLENLELSLPRLDGRHIGKVRKELKENNLRACTVSIHANYVRSQGAFHEIKTTIPLVPELHSDKLIIVSGNKDQARTQQDWRILTGRTKELLQLAKAYDVRLLLEPLPNHLVGSTEEAKRFLKECHSPNLGLVLDMAALNIMEKEPIQAIETLGDMIQHVHISDIKKAKYVLLAPGEGDVPIRAMLNALQGIAYQGDYVVNLPNLDPHFAAPRALDAMRKIMAG